MGKWIVIMKIQHKCRVGAHIPLLMIQSFIFREYCNEIFGRSRVQIPVPTNLTEVFSWFSSIIKANAGLDFQYHHPFDHYSSNSYIIKLKSVNLTNETLTSQQYKYTAFWYIHKDPRRDMTKMLKRL